MKFFLPEGKKLKNLGFLGKLSKPKPKPKMADPSTKNLSRPDLGQKKFDPDPSLITITMLKM